MLRTRNKNGPHLKKYSRWINDSFLLGFSVFLEK
jgi:hypothetical protein